MSTTAELEARVRALEERLHAVEGRQAIENLKARYGELADRRYRRGGGVVDSDELASVAREIGALFTEDAVWDGGATLGLCHGRAAIVERMAQPTLQFAWHYFLKPQIAVDGDTARATWDVLAPCTTTDGRAHWMAGVEEDEYRRVDGTWLHSRMRLDPVFFAPYDRGWGRQQRRD